MIQANELRPNSYYGFAGVDELDWYYKELPGRLRMNEDMGLFVEFSAISNEMLSEFILSNISGIPITPEILEKAGFEMCHQNPRQETFYINKQGYCPFYIYTSRSDEVYYNENLPLKYLHQLQNLYFVLTGNELEITL